jgi:hypothetical protein
MDVWKATGTRGFDFKAPIAITGIYRRSFAGIEERKRSDAKRDHGRGGDKPERNEFEERTFSVSRASSVRVVSDIAPS